MNEYNCNDVLKSWEDGIKLKEENTSKGILGFRKPQIGAICAIKSNWTISNKSVTIVMPTGTGKTETMLATIISEKCKKVLIIVPSDLLRKQTYERAKELSTLRKINVVYDEILNPITYLLDKSINSDEMIEILNNNNIIVTTMNMLNRLDEKVLCEIINKVTDVIIDEAHHIPSKTWSNIKSKFLNQRVLQFTATPYRDDGKKIDGDIIYNFPLKLAQEQKYFKNINFRAVEEYDPDKSDLKIAEMAIQQLEKDLANGNNHIVLARANTKNKANYLYEKIYKKYYYKYNPIIVTSSISKKAKDIAMKMLSEGKSKILVCVDMFGEGIDIPELKIAAMHDKYKSLPITVQFIGRFAREKLGLGDATIISNIADVKMKKELENLYSQDVDWNISLSNISNEVISKEVELQDFSKGFSNKGISVLTPKISAIPYEIKSKKFRFENWKDVFEEQNCKEMLDPDKKILVILEKKEEKIEWIIDKNISNNLWNIYILYYNEEKKIAFVHSKDKSIADRLINSIFYSNASRIKDDTIFKSLYNINRLMLTTVGLKCEIDGPIRYKMFAGIDIEDAIAEIDKSTCTKLNLFGIGYENGQKISIGCSKNGIIWSRWLESVKFWVDWCENIREKIQDKSINTSDILRGAIIPKVKYTKPLGIPILIQWPMDLDMDLTRNVTLVNGTEINIYDSSIELNNKNSPSNAISFVVRTNSFIEEFEQIFDEVNKKVYFKSISDNKTTIKYGKKENSLEEYFQENPPKITFSDQSSVEKEYYIEIPNMNISLDETNKERWDWKQVDITKESQFKSKNGKLILMEDSIQYNVIRKLKELLYYDVVIDDDSSGEMADVIAIKMLDNSIIFDLFHCKYSKGENVGKRVGDLYEVCGQAQKSISWQSNLKSIVKHIKSREISRNKKYGVSRLEVGNMKILDIIEKKMSTNKSIINITIVQPGINIDNLTQEMNTILCNTKASLLITYNMKFKIIGS